MSDDAPKRVGPLGTELMSQVPELPPPSEDGAPPVPGYGLPPEAMPMPEPPRPPAPVLPAAAPVPLPTPLPSPGAAAPEPRGGGSAIAERVPGVLLLLAGFFVLAINAVLLYVQNEYYPKLLIIAPPTLWGGAWILIFGKPIDPRTGSQPPWWLIGMFVGMFLGLIAGLVAAFALSA